MVRVWALRKYCSVLSYSQTSLIVWLSFFAADVTKVFFLYSEKRNNWHAGIDQKFRRGQKFLTPVSIKIRISRSSQSRCSSIATEQYMIKLSQTGYEWVMPVRWTCAKLSPLFTLRAAVWTKPLQWRVTQMFRVSPASTSRITKTSPTCDKMRWAILLSHSQIT